MDTEIRSVQLRNGRVIARSKSKNWEVIFHPGKGMSMEELKAQVRQLMEEIERLENEKTNVRIYVEKQRKQATLVSPLGVYRGRKSIVAGLTALKSILAPSLDI